MPDSLTRSPLAFLRSFASAFIGVHRRFHPKSRIVVLVLAPALAGCWRSPPTHLEQLGPSAGSAEVVGAAMADICEGIDGIKAKYPELSGWRPARSGVRSLTYDYKGCRVWLDIRPRDGKQPVLEREPRLRLPELGLNVYCEVEARAKVRKAVEAVVGRHLETLVELDRRRTEGKAAARTRPRTQGKTE